MPFINFPAREVNCKIVYYGPGLGGKTTNIQHIYKTTRPESRGKLITLDTDADRTLFFDFLPLLLGSIMGYRARFFLYTVPGQVFYEATRRLVLKDADGVVFVADSQSERMDANLESLDGMRANLVEHGLDPDTVPLVLQYNKRDLARVETVEALRAALKYREAPEFEAVATDGYGVFDTLKTVIKGIVHQLRDDAGFVLPPG